MSLVVIGLNHRTAPVEVRESLAFGEKRRSELLPELRSALAASEVILLSTCNRTEIYINQDVPQPLPQIAEILTRYGPTPDLLTHLYRHTDAGAVRHLFRVAAGLDSMVVGEHEILGQVKTAYLESHRQGLTAKLMNVLFQRALFVGKRVRTETGLSLGASSIGSVAVTMAERIFGSLQDRVVMILGAGKMAELTAKYLLSQKVKSILVSNRTYERAQELAAQFGGQALTFEQGFARMSDADIVICSTAAPHPIIEPDHVRDMLKARGDRSLFFIDIAVPRNVHPDVHRLDNVYLYNIDDLQSIINENRSRRVSEVQSAESIVEEKATEFSQWLTANQAGQDQPLRHSPRPITNPD